MFSDTKFVRFSYLLSSIQLSHLNQIHATLHLVDRMQLVIMEYALAYQNIKEIRIGNVDLNVFKITIVLRIKHVQGINV